jgi:gamma-glutamylcyclotransferase (GGCT)/AIG2-like uncharacterized protein YtfP
MTATQEAVEALPQSPLNPPSIPPQPRPDGLFVYGTLMPSRTNTLKAITGLQKLETSPAILYDYELYHVAHFPGIVPATSPNMAVAGEFINLTNLPDDQWMSCLKRLDGYEGCPNLYRRTVEVVETDQADSCFVYVYVWNNPITPRMQKGAISNAKAKDPNYQVLEWR